MSVAGVLVSTEIATDDGSLIFDLHRIPAEHRFVPPPGWVPTSRHDALLAVLTEVYVCRDCGSWQLDGWLLEDLVESALAEHYGEHYPQHAGESVDERSVEIGGPQ